MQFWTNIVQTALLGTDKKQVSADELTEDLNTAYTIIHSNTTTDKEDKFLQTAALAFNYRQSGAQPLQTTQAVMEAAPAETQAYCSPAAQQVLLDILAEDSAGLLNRWLELCAAKQQIVQPAVLPALLNEAAQHNTFRPLAAACMGNRGKWLSRFNPSWQFAADKPDEDLWQTGTPEQRKRVLLRLAHTDPATARSWLQETWTQENAAGRTELLKGLPPEMFADDLTWLEGLQQDKSIKVKEEVQHLLKQLPASSVVQQYWEVLQQAVTLKKEKALLGLSSKTVLYIQLPENIDERIFKTGIEKTSSQKGVSDEDMILSRLISAVPPHLWEAHLQETPANIKALFQKEKAGALFVNALGLATGRFKNSSWTALFLDDEQGFYHDILRLLPKKELEPFLLKRFAKYADLAMRFLAEETTEEWGLEITRTFMQHASRDAYRYNRAFYKAHIHLIPVHIAGELNKYVPKEEYLHGTWAGISDYIQKLLSLKTQTIKAFQ